MTILPLPLRRHNKKRIPLNLLLICISAESARQVLSIKDECTFLLLIFLLIGLCIDWFLYCNWFDIFSFSIAQIIKTFIHH